MRLPSSIRRPSAVLLTLLALLGAGTRVQAQDTSAVEPWQIIPPAQSSLVLARDGSLIGQIGREWRTSVALSSLPAYVHQAFVAVEDRRFYQHDGVDVVGIASAIRDNLLGASRGASTITQQLVGNMHPTIIDRSDRSISRKVREQLAAREMEKRYSKQQILEAYLNQIHFGRNWYGIESAARHYFGKGAAELTIAEAASLAALPKGPAIYDPIRYPERNKNRRDAIIGLMLDQGYITRTEAASARREPLRVAPNAGMSVAAPYFVDAVRQTLERAGVPVQQGGLRITTTVDPVLQRAAKSALLEGIQGIEGQRVYRHPTPRSAPREASSWLQGAVVAMDPATGDVRALVGGRDYATAPYNRATNGTRQPGSTFKPIVYARALMDSMPPTAIVPDTAITIAYDAQVYSPKNADGEFLGPLTMRTALARSRNPVAVMLWQREGADSVIALAQRMGISSPIAPFPASAIGASALRPIELVSAFTAFANYGRAAEPRLVLRVQDAAGRTLWGQGTQLREAAMDSAVAYVAVQMMRDAVDRGTGTAVRRSVADDVQVAGKTGTTDDNTDVWFVGMAPNLVAGVWLGFDRPRTITPGAGGGGLAAPIFGTMLARWGGASTEPWPVPSNIVWAEIDRETGDLADASTPPERRYVESFVAGTEPGALRVDARRLFLTFGPLPGM
ncbi:MAG TPA: PBP1A family penicillin-binding protein [Gemmatimonadaceae bacterium]|nr:PBP1A family penicillin-binding protein [Gemmatimonadaceae bacterium]